MDVAKVSQIVVLMLSPSLIVGALIYSPRCVRLIHRTVFWRRGAGDLLASHRPIERVAADLRRLLQRHEVLRGSPEIAVRARRLWALEAAIADCATEAAGALGVPYPERPVSGAMPTSQLRSLLRALGAAGLVLPSANGLIAPKTPRSALRAS